jgi:hypothetical protein
MIFMPQHISNSLNGLGYLAQTKRLIGTIDSGILTQAFTELLSLDDVNTQRIANSLNSLGYLAKADCLAGTIDASILNQACIKLLTLKDCLPQHLANSLCSIGRLQAKGLVTGQLSSLLLKELANKLIEAKPNSLNLIQTLEYWTTFINPTEKEEFKLFLRLANQAIHLNYLHPSLAVRLLPSLIAYKNCIQDERLETLYQEFLPLITIPFGRFSTLTQDSLKHNLTALDAHPVWKSGLLGSLSLPQPTLNSQKETNNSMVEEEEFIATASRRVKQAIKPNHSQDSFFKTKSLNSIREKALARWRQANQNSLFRAISKSDEEGLKRLLHLLGKDYPSRIIKPKAKRTTGDHHPPRARSARANNSATGDLVKQFFTELPVSALKDLIAKSEARYFVWLFKACTIHERYQLCQLTEVYVLWQNLPLAELNKLIDIMMITPFSIYIDHQALTHLIDALTIRLAQRPTEEKALLALQEKLLNQGISFHEKRNHIHVIPRLRTLLTEVSSNNARLLGEENLQREETETPTAPISSSQSTSPTPPEQDLVMHEPVQEISRVIRPGLFQPSVLRPPRTGPKNYYPPNPLYFYEEKEIDKILEYRMKDLNDSSIVWLGAVQLEPPSAEPAAAGACIAAALDDWKSKTFLPPDSVTKLIVPIEDTGRNHWVVMQINWQGTQVKELFYFDGYFSPEDQRAQLKIIHRDLVTAQFITHQTQIKRGHSIKQTDGSSCGALVIENIYCHNKGITWQPDPNLMTTIRERQLRLLKEKDPIFFHYFGKKQEENRRTVLDIEERVRAHGLSQI